VVLYWSDGEISLYSIQGLQSTSRKGKNQMVITRNAAGIASQTAAQPSCPETTLYHDIVLSCAPVPYPL
jgi:hypothetical protein